MREEIMFMANDIVGSEVCNALDWLIYAAAFMLLIMAGMSIHAENIIVQNTEYIQKKDSRDNNFLRGKFTWIYLALPLTVLAVAIWLAYFCLAARW